MVLKECVSFMTQLFLCRYIAFQFTFMYTIYLIFHYFQQCRYTQCTLFLCLQMLAKKRKTTEPMNNTFVQITQLMQVARVPIIVPTKNDDPYLILMLKQVVVAYCIFWNICPWKSNILYNNVLDILSELKKNGLPISVTITCMLTFWLLLSLCCYILYDKGSVINV